MSHRTWPAKQLLLLFSILVAVIACQKHTPGGGQETEFPPQTAAFESLFTVPTISFCGNTFVSNLKVRNGNNIGTVTVGNDNNYLYLTYDLKGNWYLVDVQSYAGPKGALPRQEGGSPDPSRFPGKETLSPCDLRQTFTFRVPLSSLTSESEADCAARYFTAMRATLRQIPTATACGSGDDEEAWAAPILINPGKDNEWATAFYYCKQDCPPPPPPAPAWCAYGQGYWFASGKSVWCRDIEFGTLKVSQTEGVDLWSQKGKPTTLQKAFYQASALQLSMKCMNGERPIPAEIADAYNTLATVLNNLDPKDLKTGQLPKDADDKTVQDAAGAIGKWICAHKCGADDPTDCSQ